MKVVILTYPLNNNFGNLLQAWALKHFLQELNYQVSVIDRLESYQHSKYIFNQACIFIRRLLRMKVYSTQSRSSIKHFSQIICKTELLITRMPINNKPAFL